MRTIDVRAHVCIHSRAHTQDFAIDRMLLVDMLGCMPYMCPGVWPYIGGKVASARVSKYAHVRS